ncbi:hypothetical protein [Mesoterricola sediminis]|uniref:Uncharacterized protein n=1 Tax=Mesoterricola sediminis TaxID=2927980 RepID=A0AA48GW33_9BACT|nr:hypothetical protein [Mesoterricola sediminis]BDU78687.1 hypothetical protein METESE_36450 [Mesoterricola sediminis]
MLKAVRIPIDSDVLGRNVVALTIPEPAPGFRAFEADYVAQFDPGYAYAKVPLASIPLIHGLESEGFQWIECQIQSSVRLRRPFDVSAFPGYAFEQVEREEDLAEVLDIAASTFTHDRWSIDPGLPPGLAGLRYRAYVRNSLQDPRERVYRLRDLATGRVLAFKTHRLQEDGSVLFLLGGVHPEVKAMGLGLLNEYLEFNVLFEAGVRRGITHISAANHAVFNLEIGRLGFRVLQTSAVLRKLYP